MAIIQRDNTFVQVNKTMVSYTGPVVPPSPPEENYYQLTNRSSSQATITISSGTRGYVFVNDELYGGFSAGQAYLVTVPGNGVVQITGLSSTSGAGAVTSDSASNNISVDRFDESGNPENIFKDFSGLQSVTAWTGASDYTSLSGTFEGSTLTTIPQSWTGLHSLTDLSDTFRDTNLIAIPSSYEGLDLVTDFSGAFADCDSLVSGGDSELSHLAIQSDTSNMFSGDYAWTGNAQAIYEHLRNDTTDREGMFTGCTSATGYSDIPTNPWGGGNDGITGEYTLLRNIGDSAMTFYNGSSVQRVYKNGILCTDSSITLQPGECIKAFDISTLYPRNINDSISIERWGTGCENFMAYDHLIDNTLVRVTSWEGMYNYRKTSTSYSLFNGMFSGCSRLKSIPDSWEQLFLKEDGVTYRESYVHYMFHDCTSLEAIPDSWSGLHARSYAYHMFSGCTSLRSGGGQDQELLIPLSVYHMFDGCSSWTGVDLDAFRRTLRGNYVEGASKVYDFWFAFRGCTSATNYDIVPYIWNAIPPDESTWDETICDEIENTGEYDAALEVTGDGLDENFAVIFRVDGTKEPVPLGLEGGNATGGMGYENPNSIPILHPGDKIRGYLVTTRETVTSGRTNRDGIQYTVYRSKSGYPEYKRTELTINRFSEKRNFDCGAKEWMSSILTNYSGLTEKSSNFYYYRISSWTGCENFVSAPNLGYTQGLLSIPNSWAKLSHVKYMPYTFSGAVDLTTIPSTWEGLGSLIFMGRAFSNTGLTAIPSDFNKMVSLTNMEEIAIPGSLPAYPTSYTFSQCKHLSSVSLNGIRGFWSHTFESSSIQSLSIDLSMNDYNAYTYLNYAFSFCTDLSSCTIVGGNRIDGFEYGFNCCSALSRFNIDSFRPNADNNPDVFSWGIEGAFSSCVSLSTASSILNKFIADSGSAATDGRLAHSFFGCIADPNYSNFSDLVRGSSTRTATARITFKNVAQGFNPNHDAPQMYWYWVNVSGNTWDMHWRLPAGWGSSTKPKIFYSTIMGSTMLGPDASYTIDQCSTTTGTGFELGNMATSAIEEISDTAASAIVTGATHRSGSTVYFPNFNYCNKLKKIPKLYYSDLDVCANVNVREAFYRCENVEEGILDMYNYLNGLNNTTNHSATFYKCGINTVTGSAELAQVPDDWKRSY